MTPAFVEAQGLGKTAACGKAQSLESSSSRVGLGVHLCPGSTTDCLCDIDIGVHLSEPQLLVLSRGDEDPHFTVS